ncbi:MAG: hypothetical protein COA90_00620 [Gammaproteobacteria bacterium]|nr:MAG: hypothetical protein COA90_00620 [Gammaproteobacteria bacterium]
MTEETIINKLYDEAFELVFAWHDMPSKQAKYQINQFKSLSTVHQAAIEKAEEEWLLLGQIEPKALSLTEKAHLFVDLKTASLIDQPQQALPVMMVLLLVLFLPEIGLLNLYSEHDSSIEMANSSSTIYRTHYGEQAEYTLDDGTVLSLNWDSEVAVSYTEKLRHISLIKGEAIFTVAKNPDRPFIVDVDNIHAKAVGTEFSVHNKGHYADIAVTEGIVEVSVDSLAKNDSVLLKKNQRVIAHSYQLGRVQASSINEIKAWQSGMLVFNNHPLSEVLAEFNRYTAYNIVMNNFPNTAQDVVTGTFFIDDIDDALLSVIQMFGLQSTRFNKKGIETVSVGPQV